MSGSRIPVTKTQLPARKERVEGGVRPAGCGTGVIISEEKKNRIVSRRLCTEMDGTVGTEAGR